MLAVRLIGVLALVALNGFFAATEFSLVAVRLSRVRQLVAKGNARARVVDRIGTRIVSAAEHPEVAHAGAGVENKSMGLAGGGGRMTDNLSARIDPKAIGKALG